MATMPNNGSFDKSSGAIIFKRSPELKELKELKKEIKDIQSKLDCIMRYLSIESEEQPDENTEKHDP